MQEAQEIRNGNGTEDFGAYIPGSRKEKAAQDLDRGIRSDPGFKKTLRESWATPNWRKLFEKHAVENRPRKELACIRALRDQLRTANGRRYEREVMNAARYPERMLRNLGLRLIEREIDPDRALAELYDQDPIIGERCRLRTTLYQVVGHQRDLKDYICARDERKWLVYSPGRCDRRSAEGETLIQAARDLAGKINSEPESATTPTRKQCEWFHVRYRTSGGVKHYGIWRRSSVGLICVRKCENRASAHRALEEEGAQLDAWWERWRKIPEERKQTNEPRTPSGANETREPGEFTTRFGFRGVQFGNWVEESRRLNDLTDTSQALFDLASVLGWEEGSLSLGGRLALAFGARGRGGRAGVRAHYEGSQRVIAISKTLGPGTLAHEWFHGLDHNTAVWRKIDETRFATEGDGDAYRTGRMQPLADALCTYGAAVHWSKMRRRSQELDRRRPKSKPYWATTRELAARGFEAWIVRRLALDGIKNDYLANVRPAEAWEAAAGPEQGYPYPYANELMELEPHLLRVAAAGRELQAEWQGD